MTESEGEGVELTPAQRSVVTSARDDKLLVPAQAGAGKTTTLIRRIEHLMTAEGTAASEILIWTFSRAAAQVLRTRAGRSVVAGRRVRAQTFDSWASSLLLEAGYRPEDLSGFGFDRRIELATAAIEDGVVEETERGAPAHVIIDEVQDLVGPRREMVESFLDRFPDMGFTVVGDSAQSIYGFQVSDPQARAEEAGLFFRWLRATFGDELREVVLAENFRARTVEARCALPCGESLQRLSDILQADLEAVAALVRDIHSRLAEVASFGRLDTPFAQDSLRDFAGTTAILCRDNAQVLLMSEKLGQLDVPHRVQRSPRSGVVPAWVAGLITATGAVALGRERFEQLLTELEMPANIDIDETWRSLRTVAAGARNQLDLEALRRAAAEGRLPDELSTLPSHQTLVSTVHRAKGLEFDRVLIAGFDATARRRIGEPDTLAEARLLYVAMTRPRDDLYRVECPDTWTLRKGEHLPTPVGRWYVGGRERWKRVGVEGIETDVCHEVPAGVREPETDPVAAQKYLLDSVRPGSTVVLRRLHDLPSSPTETPPYGIFHADTPIGEVSKKFRQDLWRLLKRSAGFRVKQWPYLITGLKIDCVETVAGSTAVTERHGLGGRGVWLAPRLGGLGRFDWTHAERVPEGQDIL
ncbi:UvrD-helicase domain-containing protein [Amycolatopsis sp. BJA-103]|uniref:UvrD-helicase domain-containing protein n=1 Tax=Amycolatopsis sp. BJA-103 TaxID=1911175 RepID=UPI000C75EB90|nr:UvrD-helicase domain-containing protein [Amycolatopsis sp. BJA-103]AUI62951.1 DNA helicase [Amycolatopsis sp. BJA-103]PNE18793.1 DNA helicase [Amycolatopsis sp. BJA-103]